MNQHKYINSRNYRLHKYNIGAASVNLRSENLEEAMVLLQEEPEIKKVVKKHDAGRSHNHMNGVNTERVRSDFGQIGRNS
jgi:hypothetical protein